MDRHRYMIANSTGEEHHAITIISLIGKIQQRRAVESQLHQASGYAKNCVGESQRDGWSELKQTVYALTLVLLVADLANRK